MDHVKPRAYDLSPWFKKGEVQQQHFHETPRDSLRNAKNNQIPMMSVGYAIFGDIGIPSRSPDFSKYYIACNKIYIALQALAKALASTEKSELPKLFANAVTAFEEVEAFEWPVPAKSRFPTFADNREKIIAACTAVSLYYAPENLTKIETIDEITAHNDEATTECQMLSSSALRDTKYSLLASRALAESDRLFQVCQNSPTAEDVTSFVNHSATAIMLREKISKPSKYICENTERLVDVLNKHHRDAYESFLSNIKKE